MIPFIIVGIFIVGFIYPVLEMLGFSRENSIQLAAFFVVIIVPIVFYIWVINSPVIVLK